jgi:hypothetical protein
LLDHLKKVIIKEKLISFLILFDFVLFKRYIRYLLMYNNLFKKRFMTVNTVLR